MEPGVSTFRWGLSFNALARPEYRQPPQRLWGGRVPFALCQDSQKLPAGQAGSSLLPTSEDAGGLRSPVVEQGQRDARRSETSRLTAPTLPSP